MELCADELEDPKKDLGDDGLATEDETDPFEKIQQQHLNTTSKGSRSPGRALYGTPAGTRHAVGA